MVYACGEGQAPKALGCSRRLFKMLLQLWLTDEVDNRIPGKKTGLYDFE